MIHRIFAGFLAAALISSTSVAGGESYEYDKLNRLTKVTYEDGSYVEYEYDANGNITHTEVHEASTEEENKDTGEGSETSGPGGESGDNTGGGDTEEKKENDTEDTNKENQEDTGGEEEKGPSFIDTARRVIRDVVQTILGWIKSIFGFR